MTEVHGSIRSFTCLACSRRESLAAVLAQLGEREAPVCPGCGEILKPGVVMFGELLPLDAMARAETLAREAPVAPRRRLVARGVAGRGAPRRDDRGGRHRWRSSTASRRRTTASAALVVREAAGATLAAVAQELGCMV